MTCVDMDFMSNNVNVNQKIYFVDMNMYRITKFIYILSSHQWFDPNQKTSQLQWRHMGVKAYEIHH